MATTLQTPAAARHLQRLDGLRPSMAKAVKKYDLDAWRTRIGEVIERAFALAGLTQKEAAALLDRDQAQIARWMNGSDRPQFDAIFAVESLRQPLIQALAELAGNVVVETVVRMRTRRRA